MSPPPGPGRYNFNFIKKCWDFVGNDFIKCVSNFFIMGMLPIKANTTWASLAPKVEEATEIKYCKPISMVRCIYKVVMKILAN